MTLTKLNKSVIVFDTEFLIKSIKNNHDFYAGEYPGHTFKDINILNIIRSIALTSDAISGEEIVYVIFFYKLNNSQIPFSSEPNDVFIFNDFVNRPLGCKMEDCIFHFASFYADPEANQDWQYKEEFCQLLKSISSKQATSNISIVADDTFFEDTLQELDYLYNKKFIIYRSTDTEMYHPEPPKFWNVNFDYIIANEMGVQEDEI